MILNKIYKNAFLVIVLSMLLSACATQKKASIGMYSFLPLIDGSGDNPFVVNNEFG